MEVACEERHFFFACRILGFPARAQEMVADAYCLDDGAAQRTYYLYARVSLGALYLYALLNSRGIVVESPNQLFMLSNVRSFE